MKLTGISILVADLNWFCFPWASLEAKKNYWATFQSRYRDFFYFTITLSIIYSRSYSHHFLLHLQFLSFHSYPFQPQLNCSHCRPAELRLHNLHLHFQLPQRKKFGNAHLQGSDNVEIFSATVTTLFMSMNSLLSCICLKNE